MSYRPPPQQPSQFGMGTPPIMQYTIDASNNWLASLAGQDPNQVADSVVQYYSSAIDNFIATRRQNQRLGVIQQNRAQATAPGIGVDMIQNGGMETIRITVYPEYAPVAALPTLLDMNYDGYFALIFNQGTSPATQANFLLNGVTIVSDYAVSSEDQFKMVLFAFGPTALRCQSLNDKTNQVLAGAASMQCNPPLGNTKAVAPNIVNGGFGPPNPIPPHKNILTYFWAADFADQLNPLNNVALGPDGVPAYNNTVASFWQTYAVVAPPFPAAPVLDKIYYWKDASKSPLNLLGKNQFSMAGNTPTFPAISQSMGIAEFFDRNKVRSATSSWKYPAGPNVSVNDTPVFWDAYAAFSDIYLGNLYLDFDLTPSNTAHADADTPGNVAINGPNLSNYETVEKAKTPTAGGNGPPQVFEDFASFAQA